MGGMQEPRSNEGIEMIKSRIEHLVGRGGARRAREAMAVRAAVTESGPMTPAQASKLARNLAAILDAACAPRPEGRITRSAVAEAAGMRDASGKSSRLHEYTLPDDAPEHRIRRLARRPSGYLRLTEAAALLSGGDVDEAVVRLVQGTALAACLSALPEDADPDHLDLIAAAVAGAARRITEASNLDWYYRTVDGCSLAARGDAWAVDQSDPFISRAIPRIWLFTEILRELGAQWVPHGSGADGQQERRVKVEACIRVGLALAPLNPEKQVRPYFVRRAVLAVDLSPGLSLSGQSGEIGFPGIDLGSPDIIGASSDRAGHYPMPGGTLLLDEPSALGDVFGSLLSQVDDDLEYEEANVTGLTRVLGSGRPTRSLVDGDMLPFGPDAMAKAPPGSQLAAFEAALHRGLHTLLDHRERPLMDVLGEEVARRVETLQKWVYAETTVIDERLTMLSRGERP